jgi:hypothetical protein
MQTVYARHTYDAADIVWGARLVDIMIRTPEDDFLIDYGKFDAIEHTAVSQAEPIKA